MQSAICHLSVVPLRANADHRSEMVSQLLFGESFVVLAEDKEWIHIRTNNPVYEGWLQRGQYVVIEGDFSDVDVVDVDGGLASHDNQCVTLLHGALIPRQPSIEIDGKVYAFSAARRQATEADFDTEFPRLIEAYLSTPYLWGGRTRYGIDCSGLSQLVCRHFGIQLPRDASQQAALGTVVDFFSEIRAGDLAFFDNEDGTINHVGIVVNEQTIFHASVSVRLDRFDTQGIYNEELSVYTHKLRIIKRMSALML